MEVIANELQTVEVNNSVLFQTALSSSNPSIIWRAGSGLVTLRGLGPQLRARFRVAYHANVALSTGAEIAPVEMAVRINGEGVASSLTMSTPAAVEEFNSISASTLIDVPAGCCTQITLANVGTTSIDVQNASMTIERVA